MAALADGTYDVVVIDACDDAGGMVHLDLAVVSGEHKGDVLRLAGPRREGRDGASLLGLPATVRVHEGVPRLTFP